MVTQLKKYPNILNDLSKELPPRTNTIQLLDNMMAKHITLTPQQLEIFLDYDFLARLDIETLDEKEITKLSKHIRNHITKKGDIALIINKQVDSMHRPKIIGIKDTSPERLTSVQERLDYNQKKIIQLQTEITRKGKVLNTLSDTIKNDSSLSPDTQTKKIAEYQERLTTFTDKKNKHIIQLEKASAQDLTKLAPENLKKISSHPLAADIIKHNGNLDGFAKKVKISRIGKAALILNL